MLERLDRWNWSQVTRFFERAGAENPGEVEIDRSGDDSDEWRDEWVRVVLDRTGRSRPLNGYCRRGHQVETSSGELIAAAAAGRRSLKLAPLG